MLTKIIPVIICSLATLSHGASAGGEAEFHPYARLDGTPSLRIALIGMGHLAATETIPSAISVMKFFEAGGLPPPEFVVTDRSRYWSCNLALAGIRYQTAALAAAGGIQFFDMSNPVQAQSFRRMPIDVAYVQTPGSDHVPTTIGLLGHAKVVLVEKPFAVSEKDFVDLENALKLDSRTQVLGVDHGRTGLLVTPEQREGILKFGGGGITRVSALWMEDSSYRDKGPGLAPGNTPHEREAGRDETFRDGMSVDQQGHNAAMGDLFLEIDSAEFLGARAARYQGSRSHRDTMSGVLWEASVRTEWGGGRVLFSGYVGKGIGGISGMGLERWIHGVLLKLTNGNYAWLSSDDRMIYLITARGEHAGMLPLDSRPNYVTTLMNAATNKLGDMTFSLRQAQMFFRFMRRPVDLVDAGHGPEKTSLATYPTGSPDRASLSLEEILRLATVLQTPANRIPAEDQLTGQELRLPTAAVPPNRHRERGVAIDQKIAEEQKPIEHAIDRVTAPGSPLGPQATTQTANTVRQFQIENGQFMLDGQPFQIIAGEMHYPRIPRAYWRRRLKMAKAMGLNTITTYAFWNVHESKPEVYDFSGQKDVAEFIREAQQEGLFVILRPGPYVCAEWEWGGYPAWLLKRSAPPDIVVRSSDPKFMDPAKRWLMRLGRELAPLQIGRGGPIIAVQVENEYGSFGNDHAYMELIHGAIVHSGFNNALLFTADDPKKLLDGGLPELPKGINFVTGKAKRGFDLLRQAQPKGPFMTTEYWVGWFDSWDRLHSTSDNKELAAEFSWILDQGYSASMYMFHGGTNFGWMNGADLSDGYQPDVTSYDYDAPLDESGRPTEKYRLLRDAIAASTGIAPPPVPTIPAPIAVAAFSLPQSVSLWNTLPTPVLSAELKTMEDLDQEYGYILYRTNLPDAVSGELKLEEVHDYALIYANGQLLGTLDRRLGQNSLKVKIKSSDTQLDILVENTGRANYSEGIRGERKGITKQVTLAGQLLSSWKIYSLPMNAPDVLTYDTVPCAGACFYRGSFSVDKPGDTFLDTSNFNKGFVWVNGRPLGRVWNIGPQKTLYLPGPWLKKGKNDVVVFDLFGVESPALSGKEAPQLDAPVAGKR